VVADDDYDTFSLLDLAWEAIDMAEDCVKYRPHLGGKVMTGTKHVLKMLIFGLAEARNGKATAP